MNKLVRLLALMLALAVCMAGAALAEEPVPTPELSPTAAPVATPDPNAVMITINGDGVTPAHLDQYSEYQ